MISKEKIDYLLTKDKQLYIYSSIYKFLEYNPPCKNCLVQSMCIKINTFETICLKSCHSIRTFINDNECLFISLIKKFIKKREKDILV